MNEKLNYFTAIKFLSKYIIKHIKNFVMFYIGWFFDMALSISIPILFGIMVDEIVYYQNLDKFIKISLVFVIMCIFSCVLYFFIYAQHHYLMSMYTFDIKKDVFKHLQKCDSQYMTDSSTGDILALIQTDSIECMHFVIRNIIHLLNGIIAILIIIFYIFIINWKIGIFVLFAAPVSVFANSKFGKKIRNYGNKQRNQYGTYISWVYEILSALRDIRMLGAEKKTNETFEKSHKKIFDVNIKSSISTITANNIISFANLCVQLAIFIFAGYLALNNNITIGVLTIIVAFFAILTQRISQTSSSYLDSQNRISNIQHIYNFLNSPSEDTWTGKEKLEITQGNIVFENIDFAYNKSNTVLNKFNMEIDKGERFALVGNSGSGKTTLAYMLIGFYRPQSGKILIDGQDISKCSLHSIRQSIGLIQQDVLIFDGTIKENILLSKKKATHKEIEFACKQSGLSSFINNLPNGLDTIIGENGVGLSGGQKQRIAIARIYLKNPKIIIFDEATSSLDAETEEAIHKQWEDVLKNRTSIVIAHRQSSVMLCQKVAILKDGQICEMGIPSEMEKNSTIFKTLFAIKEEEVNV